MAILEEATTEELARLLDLFPAKHLRQVWTELKKDKKKRDLGQAVAGQRPTAQIAKFVDDHFSCCRQHVYIYERDENAEDTLTLPKKVVDGERVGPGTTTRGLYIARVETQVLLVEPTFQQTSISFLWPVVIETYKDYVIVRFVVLEKNIASYFAGTAYPGARGIDEKEVLRPIIEGLQLKPTSIQKGIKKLWDDDFMDGHHTRYKNPDSVASLTMNEEKGIKKHKKKLYEELKLVPLTQMIFKIAAAKKLSVDVFSTDPSQGTLSFPHYSDKPGDTDRVVREILRHN